MSARSSDTQKRRLYACDRGAASIEYLVVLAIAALSLTATLVMLGPGLVESWSRSRAILYGPAP
ncbi:MAG: hypothetical protein ABW252_05770 [Polyangiales bacterium]